VVATYERSSESQLDGAVQLRTSHSSRGSGTGHSLRVIGRQQWSGGRKHKELEDTNQNSYLLESNINFLQRNYAYTRFELVDKDELFPSAALHPSFRIGAYTFGGVHDLVHNSLGQVGLGADVTFYSKPGALDAFYGTNPVSFSIFLRFRPGLSRMS
jgi:hypothetical protein